MIFKSKTSQLVTVLDELIAILSAKEQQPAGKHWANWLQESKMLILNSSTSGIDHLLKAYGGMGSLNDLIVTTKFNKLRTKAYELAKSIESNS